MWGLGSAGQLGNGRSFPSVTPCRVAFPGLREDTRVRTIHKRACAHTRTARPPVRDHGAMHTGCVC
jgi:hypothetical protein